MSREMDRLNYVPPTPDNPPSCFEKIVIAAIVILLIMWVTHGQDLIRAFAPPGTFPVETPTLTWHRCT